MSDRPAGRLPAVTVQVYGAVPELTESSWLYAVPVTASGSDPVVTIGALGSTVTSFCVPDGAASVWPPTLPTTEFVTVAVRWSVYVNVIVPAVEPAAAGTVKGPPKIRTPDELIGSEIVAAPSFAEPVLKVQPEVGVGVSWT